MPHSAYLEQHGPEQFEQAMAANYECLYVRRSVANHLGDVCTDDSAWVYDLCHRWLDEVGGAEPERRKQRCWMIRHALRLPAKKGHGKALRLRERAKT